MKSIPLYIGHDHECDYLPGNKARIAYVSPQVSINPKLYSRLVASGFRRSGNMVYRPYCSECNACIPVRIPVESFRPNRAQSRILRRNSDLEVTERPAAFDPAHYQLYQRYLLARHADSDMTLASPEDYLNFVGCRWGKTGFYEFRAKDRELMAVAVIDRLDDALSAVYTFFDPDAERRSLGTFAVLWQIAEAKRQNLPWVYLGFWIQNCRKMAYKGSFRPLEALLSSNWITLDKAKTVRG
jgi:arginyl-tRNA--protein-N-Asp/Glu arginylyltransferase